VEESIDEIWQGWKEVEMLKMAVEMEMRREVGERYMDVSLCVGNLNRYCHKSAKSLSVSRFANRMDTF